MLDHTEHEFDRASAQRVQLAAVAGPEPMAHRVHRRGLFWQRCRFSEPFVQRRVVPLTTQGNQRPNFGLRAGVDVVLAGVPSVGDQHLDPAKVLGQGLELLEHWRHLLLVVGRLRDRLGHGKAVPWSEMRQHLEGRLAGKMPKKPVGKKLAR